MRPIISQRSHLTYLSALAITTVCHEAWGIVLLLQSRKSSSRKVFGHELQWSANMQLVWLQCLPSFSSSTHNGSASGTPKRHFWAKVVWLPANSSKLSNEVSTEVKQSVGIWKERASCWVGKVQKRRVQQNSHAQRVIMICVTKDAYPARVGTVTHVVTPMTALLTSASRDSE